MLNWWSNLAYFDLCPPLSTTSAHSANCSFWQEYYSYNSDVIYNSLASMHLQHSTTIFFNENTENLQGLFWLMSSPNIKVCRRFLLANATALSLFKHVLSKQYKKCDCQQSFIHLQLYWVPGRGCYSTLDAFKTKSNINFLCNLSWSWFYEMVLKRAHFSSNSSFI